MLLLSSNANNSSKASSSNFNSNWVQSDSNANVGFFYIISETNKYKINIYYTDIDKYNKTDLENFNKLISFDGGTPVTIFIKNGEEKTTATRIEGDVSTDKIIDKLKKNGFID